MSPAESADVVIEMDAVNGELGPDFAALECPTVFVVGTGAHSGATEDEMRTVRAAAADAEESNKRVSVFATTPHKHRDPQHGPRHRGRRDRARHPRVFQLARTTRASRNPPQTHGPDWPRRSRGFESHQPLPSAEPSPALTRSQAWPASGLYARECPYQDRARGRRLGGPCRPPSAAAKPKATIEILGPGSMGTEELYGAAAGCSVHSPTALRKNALLPQARYCAGDVAGERGGHATRIRAIRGHR